MKRKSIVLLFFLVSLTLFSCNKIDGLFSNGKPVTESRNLDSRFNSISMFNNVSVELIQSDAPHIELTCPENLIDKITTTLKGDSLIIRNENDFNWLRSYDYECNIKVFYDSIDMIEYASNGKLTARDSLRGLAVFDTIKDISGNDSLIIKNKTFYLNITEGSGDIDLTFNCNILKNEFSNGTATVTLRGEAGYAEHLLKSYGKLDAKDLNSNIISLLSSTTNDAYVWARTQLKVVLTSIGDVYYKGNPYIEKYISGDGNVYPIE